MDSEAGQVLGGIPPVEGAVLIVGLLGASALHFVRKHNGRDTERAQWLGDALNIGVIIVLGLIAVRAVFGNVFGIDLSDLVKNNGILIGTALAYCVVMIGASLIDSVRRKPG